LRGASSSIYFRGDGSVSAAHGTAMGASQTVCCLVLHDEHIARSFAVAKWTYCALFTVVTVITWVLR
jgi:hypothetical protein